FIKDEPNRVRRRRFFIVQRRISSLRIHRRGYLIGISALAWSSWPLTESGAVARTEHEGGSAMNRGKERLPEGEHRREAFAESGLERLMNHRRDRLRDARVGIAQRAG